MEWDSRKVTLFFVCVKEIHSENNTVQNRFPQQIPIESTVLETRVPLRVGCHCQREHVQKDQGIDLRRD